MRAAFNQLGADLERVQKARAGRPQVEAPRVGRADLLLHQAGRRRERHIRAHCRDNDDLNRIRGDAAVGKAQPRGFGGKVACGHPRVNQVALPDARALHDPLVGGVHHRFKVGIGQHARWHVGADSRDLRPPVGFGDRAIVCVQSQCILPVHKASLAWEQRAHGLIVSEGKQPVD